ncbi:MAG: ABC transporter ATP-binding protein [Thermodesulfobacteriota bacterium]
MTTVISLENVGKQYRLGVIGHGTLRHDLQSWWARLRGREDPNVPIHDSGNDKQFSGDTMWALRNISLDLKQGEVLGIIGRNGAGKSTLLKIISRLTAPTTGQVKIRGRLACLLEVGTGFHPDLTGRENVFVNGTIMGMTSGEIRSKFDEIVAFSGLERFIDTPVKRYSSGMYVRLGFAVAAHLDPEILVVDEVLAVGDADFQRKCLSKMEKAGQEGRTIVFVSHNLAAVESLCTRAIWLEDGGLKGEGLPKRVAKSYLSEIARPVPSLEWSDPAKAPTSEIVRLRAVRVRAEDGNTCSSFDIRQPIGLEIHFEVLQAGHILVPNYLVFNEAGLCLFPAGDLDPNWRLRPRPVGRFVTTAWLPGNLLVEGRFFVTAAVTLLNATTALVVVRKALSFDVFDPGEGDSARGDCEIRDLPGVLRPILEWHNEYFSV